MNQLNDGKSSPLGSSWDGQGVNFALFSAHAEKVELCLFDDNGEHELERFELPCVSDQVWHGYLPACKPGTVYAYRVYGPYLPHLGHRFNPHKLLLDPYAKQLKGTLNWNDSLFGYAADEPLSSQINTTDSARDVPKAVVVDESFDWQNDRLPRVPWSRTIIYEAHPRGFTQLHPHINAALRGSFSALASSAVISYLQTLGITTLELQPVHAFLDDQFLVAKNLRNYWGYNTLSFFSPSTRYLSSGNRNEFKTMVRELHKAGIEVILDVVYNHTAEGDESGPTLNFRGIDNASYYRLPKENPARYINDTGCGNTLNTNHPRVLQMVIDSLRYWVNDMHVDGFRFDLAVSLGREAYGFDSNSEFFKQIEQDPVLSKVKLIAEPWDIGPGGYQLGAFPPNWSEWNDRFRDAVRRFWRGDEGLLPEFASALHGFSELFEHNGRSPSASINLITSHDGFTLADLTSYKQRHNEANGESNRDGHRENLSHNYGVEGLTNDPAILELRQRQCRNFMATLFLAQGTPMLLAGDEMGRSQRGNNNAYCQDNELNWLDWSLVERNADLHKLVQKLIKLRNDYSVLHSEEYLHDARVDWLKKDGTTMSHTDWHNHSCHFLAMFLSAAQSGQHFPEQASLILVFNAETMPATFTLPQRDNTEQNETNWRCIFSTSNETHNSQPLVNLPLQPQSVYVFESVSGAAR